MTGKGGAGGMRLPVKPVAVERIGFCDSGKLCTGDAAGARLDDGRVVVGGRYAEGMTPSLPIHRAARLPFAEADAEIRERARYAPEWVKRRIDAARVERGAAPLWATASATRERAAGKVRRLRAFIASRRAAAAVIGS